MHEGVLDHEGVLTKAGALRPLLRYLLRGALADRLLLALALLLIAAAALAAFVGSTALVEQRELAVVYAAAAARLIVVVALALLTCFQVRRAFDLGEVDLLLARPVGRTEFVLAHVLLLVLLAAGAALLAGAGIGLLVGGRLAAVLAWTMSLWLEAAVIAVAALFFALTLTSGVVAALTCLGFYVLARTIGAFGAMAHAGAAAGTEGGLAPLLEPVITVLALLLPRLDLLGQSGWLVHGFEGGPGLAAAAAQGLAYLLLLAAAASFDFQRRSL